MLAGGLAIRLSVQLSLRILTVSQLIEWIIIDSQVALYLIPNKNTFELY